MAARIQVQREARRGEIIEVRVLIQHPMETGFLRRFAARRRQRDLQLECRYGGVEVSAGEGAASPRNPT